MEKKTLKRTILVVVKNENDPAEMRRMEIRIEDQTGAENYFFACRDDDGDEVFVSELIMPYNAAAAEKELRERYLDLTLHRRDYDLYVESEG